MTPPSCKCGASETGVTPAKSRELEAGDQENAGACCCAPGPSRETPPENPWKHKPNVGLGQVARTVALGTAASLVMFAAGGLVMYRDAAERRAAAAAGEARLASLDRLLAAPAAAILPVDRAVRGRDTFATTCAACHRPDGTGIPGLGKDLVHSWFVALLDDRELIAFVKTGRPFDNPLNTTGVPMPPRGGHAELSDSDLGEIITYVRGLQDPRRMPSLPAPVVAAPTEEEKAKALAAAGGDAELAEFIASGAKLFAMTCSACHGKDGKGLSGLGKDLANSTFCKEKSDDDLLAFVKRGRDPGDPANTTKVAMPPKGGNPALSDDDILDIIAYVRSLSVAQAK